VCELEVCNGRRDCRFESSSSDSILEDESESASRSSTGTPVRRSPSKVLAMGRRCDEALLPLCSAASGDWNAGRFGVDFD
jgi:hypothetical protein